MEKQNKIQKKLLYWGKDNIKSYPWRNTSDPYKILISELLLHKTDSKKVEKVYPRFIEKFPMVYDLYKAEDEEINNIFKDIGLFYRGQRLKRISEHIVNKFGGSVPEKKEDIISLYGVGNYMANAVLCFAYKKRVPIVDTNVIRVYERVFGIKSSKSRAREDSEIWDFAAKMLPQKGYVQYNYALLDFASGICRAKKPLCESCPINSICQHHKEVVKNERKAA